MEILVKSAGESPSLGEGARVLVERRLPSGVKKGSLRRWLPALAPSDELRRWFEARPSQWTVYRKDYLAELRAPKSEEALGELESIAAAEAVSNGCVILLTTAKDVERSHAAILRDLLQGVRKPPSTSGPARAAAGRVQARRRR